MKWQGYHICITSDPLQDRIGLWSRKCHRSLTAGPFKISEQTHGDIAYLPNRIPFSAIETVVPAILTRIGGPSLYMKFKLLFIAGVLFALSPWASPPLALAAGLLFGFIAIHPYPKQSRKTQKWLLQGSVVGLGFGMNLQQVLKAGGTGILYTAIGIAFALTVGWLLGRAMQVRPTSAFLISTGTAICGGSAIAAVGPITGATEDEMSVSLGTVFILNSIALLTFPYIGTALHLSQNQFGLWAALAIHDTSSVVGAAAKFGAVALAIGTTVKLARALWIIPVSLGTAAVKHSDAKVKVP